jgi:uncharacterized protein (DUF927 family)
MTKTSISDFDEVAKSALRHTDTILSDYLPGGKRQGNEYVVCNPKRNDSKPGSFRVNVITGMWSDFAISDAKGGDLISLVAYLKGCSQSAAAKEIAQLIGISFSGVTKVTRVTKSGKPSKNGHSGNREFVTQAKSQRVTRVTNDSDGWEVITPIPDDAPSPPDNYKHGKPTKTWTYRNDRGQPLFHICRFDIDSGKEVLPLTFCCNSKTGKPEWRWKGLAEPRPLYNLDKLMEKPDAPVIVCEGEKASDAAEELFPGYVVTTSSQGCKSAAQTDWTPLKGRTVLIWRDNDEPGLKYAQQVAGFANEASAMQVSLINIQKFKSNSGSSNEKPELLLKGFDAADALESGWTAQDIAEIVKDDDFSTRVQQPHPKSESAKCYELQDTGVYYAPPREAGDPTNTPKKIWICSKLEIVSAVRDDNRDNWGRLLKFLDPEDNEHSWCMPMEMLKGSGEEYRGELLKMGLLIAPGASARNYLTSYIQTASPEHIARCVSKTGWYRKVFVTTEGTIGNCGDEEVIFQSGSPVRANTSQQGTLEEWQRNVAALCKGNPRLILALSASLAAPLVHILNEENCILHYRGGSTIGKTTALRVGGSVFGGKDYVKTWRSTDNHLEGTAVAHCDLPLILDEIGQVDPEKAGEIAYLIGNGQTKGRAGRTGVPRANASFRTIGLSSGELSLADHMKKAGKRTTAGQEVRVIDMPADAGAGYGLFKDLHGYENGQSFSEALKEAAWNYHGVAGQQFIEKVAANYDELPQLFKEYRKDFIQLYLPTGASNQVQRIGIRFALFAFVGELATRYGITGWDPAEATKEGEAEEAVANCLNDYIRARGGTGNHEQKELLAHARLYFEQNAESRFSDWDEHGRVTVNRAGFRKVNETGETEYFVLPETFKSEICKNFDATWAAKIFIEEGWLIAGNDTKPQSNHRLPGMGQRKCYYFSSKVFAQ